MKVNQLKMLLEKVPDDYNFYVFDYEGDEYGGDEHSGKFTIAVLDSDKLLTVDLDFHKSGFPWRILYSGGIFYEKPLTDS